MYSPMKAHCSVVIRTGCNLLTASGSVRRTYLVYRIIIQYGYEFINCMACCETVGIENKVVRFPSPKQEFEFTHRYIPINIYYIIYNNLRS